MDIFAGLQQALTPAALLANCSWLWALFSDHYRA